MCVENFGNPDNPFGEPESENLRPAVVFEPVRATVSRQIMLMALLHGDVKHIRHEDREERILKFRCSAPLEENLGIFVNEASILIERQLRKIVTVPVDLTLGDITHNDKITKRWIKLERPYGEEFGVSGVSLVSEGEFEKWRALVMRVEGDDQGPVADLWGETLHDEPVSEAIQDAPGRIFEAHYDSLRRAVGRTLRKKEDS
jgi:hypothetical protein